MSSYDAGRELLTKRAAESPRGSVSYETPGATSSTGGIVGGLVAGFVGLLAWSTGGRLGAAFLRHRRRRPPPLLYDAHGRRLK